MDTATSASKNPPLRPGPWVSGRWPPLLGLRTLFGWRTLPWALAVVCLGLGATAAVSTPASEESLWHRDLATAQAEAREQGKLLLVDFYATWCNWCRTLESQVFPSAEFRQGTERFVLVRLDIEDRQEGAPMARRYRVESVPTGVLLDPDLVEVGRVPGFSQAPQYLARIDSQLELYRALEERFQQHRQLDDPEALLSLADELYRRGDGHRSGALYHRLLASWQGPTRGDLLFRLADAHRMAGKLDEAHRVASSAQRELEGSADSELAEQIWLLRYRIAQERGNCQEAAETLEAFLQRFPSSGYAPPARRSLQKIQEDPDTCTG